MKLKDAADALLYLGPRHSLTQVSMPRSELEGTAYGTEIQRRLKVEGFPTDLGPRDEKTESPQFPRPQADSGAGSPPAWSNNWKVLRRRRFQLPSRLAVQPGMIVSWFARDNEKIGLSRSEEKPEDGLGTHARLHHRNGRSRALRNEYLAAENRILKSQIKGRLLLSDGEKATLAEIAYRLGRKALREVAMVAQPETILAWYRRLIANKFDGSKSRRRPGRPRVDIESLVVRFFVKSRGDFPAILLRKLSNRPQRRGWTDHAQRCEDE